MPADARARRGVAPRKRREPRNACAGVLAAAQILLLGLFALPACDPAPHAPTRVRGWLTTPDLQNRLTPQPDLTADAIGAGTIAFDVSMPLQAIDGFGAAFTDTSAYLLWTGLDEATRAQVLDDLFLRGAGIGLSFMRIPMGASDFAACACSYSYDDTAGDADPTQATFSTAHDDAYVIPLIRQAVALNPQMKLLANPWSPPAWMKTNGSMLGSTDAGVGTLRDDAYDALAQYFAAFVRAYRQKGVPVWAITPQNEPSVAPDTYPGMQFPAAAEAAFIAQHLAPTLAAAGLQDLAILGGDDVGALPDEAEALWATAGAVLYGTAWHCYAGLDGMTTIHQEHPDKPLYMTECSTGPTGIAGETTPQVMAATRNWGSGALLWNLALDPSGGPKQGHGCDGCTGLVTVDPAARTASYTINYYELGQFSKFVAPGAHRLASTDVAGIAAQAYLNRDGSAVVVAYNTTASAQTFSVQWRAGGTFGFTLPAGATVTFTDAAP